MTSLIEELMVVGAYMRIMYERIQDTKGGIVNVREINMCEIICIRDFQYQKGTCFLSYA